MLPDLPSLKQDIEQALYRYFQTQLNLRLGFFGEVPKYIIHECDRTRTLRADGTIDESKLKQASAELSLKSGEIPELTIKERKAKLNDMADQMAGQISKQLFGTLNEVLEKAGQVTDQKGKPLDAEAVFTVLETIELDFDETGKHKNLSIVVPPALAPKAKKVFEQIESDPILQKRHEEIMIRKRMEWRAREASRKLVG
ncbi:MAG TPA: hypothetical protein VMW89_14740 [Desulfatiglandales bacterium]|nr:hypothetical protein [Desulfatiglandales bacterium]